MRELAIHQITMMQGGPFALVRFAARTELFKICLFTASPTNADGTKIFPVVTAQEKASFRTLLSDTGVSVINAEYFPVLPNASVANYAGATELAAELGAKRLVTHIHDPDPSRSLDELDALCGLAKDHGLEVGLEFTGFASGCNSLNRALELQSAISHTNLKIAIDALHLFRTGGNLEQLAAVDSAKIGYAQLCDGPHFRKSSDYMDEAMNRMIPGEGFFPLREMIAMLGPDVDIDIEVPHFASSPHFDAERWAMDAITESRRLLDE